MKNAKIAILAAAAAVIGLGLSAPAFADGRHGQRHGGHHRHLDRHHQHQQHHQRHYGHRHIDRPVYVAPYSYYAPPVYSGYYYTPAPRYPGIVVNVDLPPLVIPLR